MVFLTDIIYKGRISEEIRSRSINTNLTLGYIFNKKWSFFASSPFDYEHTFFPEDVPENKQRKETLFASQNILLNPRYKVKLKEDKWIYYSLGLQLPTNKKIEGNIFYEEEEKKYNFYSLQPGISIENVNDPIISIIQLSFNNPLWRKGNQEGVSDLWWGKLSSDLYFLINEKYSYFTNFAIVIQKEKETYILEYGVSYFLKSFKEFKIYLSSSYNGFQWASGIGTSFAFNR